MPQSFACPAGQVVNCKGEPELENEKDAFEDRTLTQDWGTCERSNTQNLLTVAASKLAQQSCAHRHS